MLDAGAEGVLGRARLVATEGVQRTPNLQALLAHPGTGAVLFMHAPTAIVRTTGSTVIVAPRMSLECRP